MKKLSLCVLLAAFFFCVLSPYTASGAEKVITLRFAHFLASSNLSGELIQEWANEVEKRTNGRVKVMVYPGNTLLDINQMYDGVSKGIADIGYGMFAYHRGRFPLTEVTDLPLGYKNFATTTRLANAYYKKFKPKEMDDVKVLYLDGYGPGVLHSKKPVYKLEDLKGMRIRATGVSGRIISHLGGSPVGISIPDTYDALSKGIVEGAFFSWGGAYNYKIGDVTKYHIVAPAIANGGVLYTVMNKNKWDSLPPDIKVIIDKLDEEWVDRVAQMWNQWDGEGKAGLEKLGNKVISISKQENERWAPLTRPILDDYVKASKAKGLPGEEALKFCLDYLKTNDK